MIESPPSCYESAIYRTQRSCALPALGLQAAIPDKSAAPEYWRKPFPTGASIRLRNRERQTRVADEGVRDSRLPWALPDRASNCATHRGPRIELRID